jgi:hypothetical protein
MLTSGQLTAAFSPSLCYFPSTHPLKCLCLYLVAVPPLHMELCLTGAVASMCLGNEREKELSSLGPGCERSPSVRMLVVRQPPPRTVSHAL